MVNVGCTIPGATSIKSENRECKLSTGNHLYFLTMYTHKQLPPASVAMPSLA